jgi:hypothetical protein
MLYFIWYFGRCNLDAHWRETEWEHFWSYAWLRWLRNPSLLFSSFQQFFWEREREQLHVSWLKCLDYLSCCISVVVPVYVWDREISFRLLYRSWLWHAPIISVPDIHATHMFSSLFGFATRIMCIGVRSSTSAKRNVILRFVDPEIVAP